MTFTFSFVGFFHCTKRCTGERNPGEPLGNATLKQHQSAANGKAAYLIHKNKKHFASSSPSFFFFFFLSGSYSCTLKRRKHSHGTPDAQEFCLVFFFFFKAWGLEMASVGGSGGDAVKAVGTTSPSDNLPVLCFLCWNVLRAKRETLFVYVQQFCCSVVVVVA